MNRFLQVACVLACAGVFCPAYAAENTYDLGTIVVTATRTPQTIRETPTPVTVVTREELQAQGATNLKDALRTVPGVSMMRDPMGRSHLSIRGTSARHTLILIDGKRVVQDITKTLANPGIMESIGLEQVERIEVVKGASSALYGSEAIGGVINIITKKQAEPSFAIHGKTGNYAHGEHNEYRWSMEYRSGNQEPLQVALTYGARKTVPHYVPWENKNLGASGKATKYYYGLARPLSLSLGYRLDSTHQVGVDFFHQTNQEYYSSLLNNTKRMYGLMDVSNKTTTNNFSIYFDGEDGGWDYHTAWYRNAYRKDYVSNTHVQTPRGAQKSMNIDRATHVEQVWEGFGTKQVDSANRLTVGAEYRKESGASSRMLTKKQTGVYSIAGKSVPLYGADISYASVYVQDEWRPTDKWLVVPALRYDHSDHFGGELSPKLGATYFMDDRSRLKLNVGHGYVTPGLMELYYDFDMEKRIYWVGNPNLKPEKSWNFDIALEKDYADASMTWSYFYNDVTDYIVSVPYTGGRTLPVGAVDPRWNINLADVTLQGVEWTATKRLNEQFKVWSNYTFTKDKTSHQMGRVTGISRHQFNAGVDWEQGKWDAHLWGSYHAGYWDGEKTSRFGVVNALVSYRFGENRRVYLGVDNIFNKLQDDVIYTGRFYQVGFDYQF